MKIVYSICCGVDVHKETIVATTTGYKLPIMTSSPTNLLPYPFQNAGYEMLLEKLG